MNAPPRPHPFARSKASELASWAFATMWKHGLTRRPPLEPDYLWSVGSDGFSADDEHSIRSAEDVADFRERLEALCSALVEEAALNPLGHTMAYGQITAAIRKRHALGRFWNENPGMAEREIAPPILVVGQMRSGTTRVQRLLAADPRHSGTRFCNSHNPVPATPDFRPVKARAALAVARRINPWLDTVHPFGAMRTDEEIGWLAAALSPATFEAQWRIPSFVAFSSARDAAPVYREFARILRTDAHVMQEANRPRVLKCPQFAEELGALLTQLPDARLVLCRRPKENILESSVSMTASQMAFQSDQHDLQWLTAMWQEKISHREAAIEHDLRQFSGKRATIDFAALNADWLKAIGEAYEALDIELTSEAVAAMRKEREKSHDDPHHVHAEQMAGFSAA